MATISDTHDDCRYLDPEYRFFSDADAWSYMDQLPPPTLSTGPRVYSIELSEPHITSSDSESKADQDLELPEIFYGLAKIWKDATGGLSSTKRRFAHPTYKAILRLGPEAV